MSHAVRRRADFAEEPVDVRFGRILRMADIDWRINVLPELRKRRYHVGPAEARKLKDQRARRRRLKRLVRAA